MLSQNPDASLFNIILPNAFFIKDIVDKYSLYLKQYNYPFSDIQTLFNESLQSLQLPDFGFNMYSQNTIDVNNAGYQWNQIPKTSEQSLINDKVLNLTFRHVDGFMSYFLAMELFFARYKLGKNETKRHPFGTIILETLDLFGEPVCKIKLHQCQIIGLTGLAFTFAEAQRDFSTYDLTIGYTEFETSLNIPELYLDNTKTDLSEYGI